jgi:hypothetical protein
MLHKGAAILHMSHYALAPIRHDKAVYYRRGRPVCLPWAGRAQVRPYIYEPLPRFKPGLVTSFDKLRTNGFGPFVVSLSNH